MAAPVWKLSVDLETNSASFKTGMADAAKTARTSFKDIEHGASGMGTATRMSMTQSREAVMLLGEQFGVHLPRALTTFIAELGPVGDALQAAFPFLAIAALAGILIEHLHKLHEAGEKLTDNQLKFGTAAQSAFNDLDKKLLQAGITADDLDNNHLDALHKKLQLIDMQSMDELNHTFGILQKAADAVFKDLDAHWYTFGTGSTGAKHALDEFQAQYDSLLAKGQDKEASDLLASTRNSAEAILAAQKQMQHGVKDTGNAAADQAAYNQGVAAHNALKAAGVGWTDNEVKAQQTLVDALNAQITAQGKVNELATQNKHNATKTEDNGGAGRRAAMAREGIESRARIAEQGLAAERATADAELTVSRATIEQRLESDLAFAGKERDIKAATNQQEIAALNKSGKDYNQQLKTLQDAALAIVAEYNTKVTELKSKALVAENARDVRLMEQAEALKIAKQKEGTTARMAVIDEALQEERAKGLENTEHFQELLRQREAEARKEAEIEKRVSLDSLDAQVRATQAAAEEKIRVSSQQIATQQGDGGPDVKQIETERLQEQQSYQIKQAALNQQLAMYRKAGIDRVKQAQEVEDQINQVEQEHADRVALLKQQEAVANKQTYATMATDSEQSLMQIALGHQSLAATVQQYAQQGLQHVLEALIQEMAGNKLAQMSAAKTAAAKAMQAVSGVPVVGPALAPIAGAAVFAAAMAFEGGTDRVPGVGRGDIVPAMLTPGEGIVPGGIMDGLRNMARNGGFQPQHSTVIHAPIHMSASVMDADGVDKVFTQHAETIQKHFISAVQRTNH